MVKAEIGPIPGMRRNRHQNHDNYYHPSGTIGVGETQAQRNFELVGRGREMYALDFATHRMTSSQLRRNWFLLLAPAKKAIVPVWYQCLFAALNLTRPVRHRLGVRQAAWDFFAGSYDAGGSETHGSAWRRLMTRHP